jgi:hypothetical protein
VPSSTRERWTQLTTANNDIDAQLLIGVLDEASIESKLVKDRTGYGDYLYGGSNPWAPVAVHVHESSLEEARRILGALADESSETASEPTDSALAAHVPWPTLIAVAIVTLIVLSFLLEQRDVFL